MTHERGPAAAGRPRRAGRRPRRQPRRDRHHPAQRGDRRGRGRRRVGRVRPGARLARRHPVERGGAAGGGGDAARGRPGAAAAPAGRPGRRRPGRWRWPAPGPAADRPAPPPARAQVPELPTGTVTFLFTDIEGSTRLLQAARRPLPGGPGRARGHPAPGHRRRRRGRGQHRGRLLLRRLRAARWRRSGRRWPPSGAWPPTTGRRGPPVRVRMGLHTGEGVLGGDDYVGIDVQPGGPDRRRGPRRPGDRVRRHPRPGRARRSPRATSLRDLGEHRLQGPRPPDAPVRPGGRGTPGRLPAAPDAGRPAEQPPRPAHLVRWPGGGDRRGRSGSWDGPGCSP